MTISTRTALAAVTIAAVALIGGCSSSTTSSGESSKDGTGKAEFVSAASDICVKSTTEMTSVTTDPSNNAAAMKAQSAVLATMVTDIKALPQPTGTDAPTELYSTIDAVQTTIGQLVTAAETNDQAQGAQLTSRLRTETEAANTAWDGYGIPACGSGSSGNTTTGG